MKFKIKKRFYIILSLLILVSLITIFLINKIVIENNIISTVNPENTDFEKSIIYSQNHSNGIISKNSTCILQNPELPSGCEITTLTMALNYLDYDIDKITIANEYFPCSGNFYEIDDILYGPNIYTTFAGDPFSYDGFGCFEQAVISTVEKYISINYNSNTNIRIKNISGSSPEELYKYINFDIPVITWATIYMDNLYEGLTWYTEDELKITWPSEEHCLLLIGYNESEVIVNDPLVGTTTYDRELFEERYKEIGSHAVVIYKE